MSFPVIQNSFISGELSPSFFGRTDKAQYRNGASTMRNFLVNYRGGAMSRAGFAYVGMFKQGAPNSGGTSTANSPRDINFQLSINTGFALEFGDQYMRVKYHGAYVTEANKNITAITKANPAVFTSNAHGFLNGNWIFIQNVGGMTNFNGLTWIVVNKTNNTFQVTDLFGHAVDSSAFSAYTSGGTAARIYTTVSPYAAIDLPYLKFTQSANVMNLTCWNQQTGTEYPPYDLERVTNAVWVFTQVSFAAAIVPPSGVASTAQNSTTKSTWYSYVVTAVDENGNESIASTATDVSNNNIAINAGSNIITWSTVAGATQYNIYAATPVFTTTPATDPGFIGVSYGYVGTVFGLQFIDTNIQADFSRTPPKHTDPFARGSIVAVTPTAPGTLLTQATVGYTINTSTGSGAVLTPIVQGGGLVGFIVDDGGKNYAPADTITITGGSIQATGNLTFGGGNPSDTQTIVLNGVTWTFTSSAPVGNQTLIGATLAQTLAYLAVDLNASAVVGINVANYTVNATQLFITYNTGGAGGNAYTLNGGTAGATRSAATLTGGSGAGSGATALLTIGAQTGTYPGTAQYFQQRLAYADTINQPDTYFMSQPGLYNNFDSSIPIIDSDAITGTPWGVQINGIQFMLPMTSGLLTFTGNGVWLINGSNNAAITPGNQDAQAQAQIGCSALVPPLYINLHILYVQAKNSIVRDLAYSFYLNVFQGTDITLFSNHLFTGFTLLQWAYAEEPYKVIWAIRDDGVMLSLTYIKEQEIEGWGRHDTNGFFVGVCAVTEPPVDAIYAIVKRYIAGEGVWVYYSERANNRIWLNVEDSFCVDAGISYPTTLPNATLYPASATGTNSITGTNLISGGSGYTSPIATAVDPFGTGTGAIGNVTTSGGAITAISIGAGGQNYSQGTHWEITDPTGSGAVAQAIVSNYVNFRASASVFNAGMVGDVIRADGGKATIVTYTSGTVVVADVTQELTATIPNDPNNMPVPAIAGKWSISTPTTTVTGLNHLEGMEVTGLADGGVITPQTVVDGAITLQTAASAITIGLPFLPQIQTMYIDPPAQSTTQGKRKDIQAVTVRVEQSRGIQTGTNQPDQSVQPNFATVPWTNMKEVKERNALITAGSALPLFTGDVRPLLPGDWNERGQVAIQQPYPLPATILAVVPEFSLGDPSG